ncbi:MAG: 4-alpha-glucanotransferase [Chloroflexi bacterium HGW-Chloroflexi-6]|nr:MAG: 4-alpha-glucanotransferase [Chloroflexi bacterium HGW-Chloroflexi-6]
MTFTRSSGMLLHPTSFPGPYGIGDLGPFAYRFIDYLAETGSKLWQVLPLGPTSYGDSPYQCFSAFAGNPYMVSPDFLMQEGLLTIEDLADMPHWEPNRVDFGLIYQWKPKLLDKAFAHFEQSASDQLRSEWAGFRQSNAAWLDDYALFMALKDTNGGMAWNEWPAPQRDRDPQTLAEARERLADAITRQQFRQFLFFRQWNALRKYANSKGIQVIGDIPIFVAMDSSDAWANPGLFYLDEAGKPTVVAGVPPDYFSPTGQLWGNPLYRWDVHKASGYAWWIERIRATLTNVDIVRIDHFRGFAGYWEVAGDAPTAQTGRWVPGPGIDLFIAIRDALGDLPIIAEDLGEITPDVIELRDTLGLPGMKIFQFGFSGPENPFLPHHYTKNCVVYTGTHDNDTALGWYRTCPHSERDFYHRYLGRDNANVPGDMIRAIWSSVAVFAIAPLQDFLGLGTEARMNFPGKVGGYWAWRMDESHLSDWLKGRMKELNWLYER